MTSLATISVKDLRVNTIIGIYDHELKKAQPLYFDIDMQADISVAAKSDAIEDALDYASVAERVQQFVRSNSNKLLEGLICELSAALLAEYAMIQSLTLTVRKPNAIADAACSSITYSCTR